MPFQIGRPVWTWALLASTLVCGAGSAEDGNRAACDWSVSDSRSAGPNDIGHEDLDPRLRDPENGNEAPGPGNLFAVVKIDSLHHPHIFVEDRSTGSKRELVAGSQPRWSPAGNRIACTVWKSPKCFSTLRIIDVRTGDALSPDVPCHVVNYRWAPDGRSLAVAAVLPHSDMNSLLWVDVPTGRARLLDTLTVFSDYADLTWSPDSRALVATRVLAMELEGEPTATDLWLFDSGGQRCRLTKTKDYLEGGPKWVNEKDLVFSRRRVSDPDLGNPERRVITVTRVKSGEAAE